MRASGRDAIRGSIDGPRGWKLSGNSWLSDAVAAALITAVATAPIAGGVAYFNHSEAVIRLNNERLQHADAALLARERLASERRNSLCAGVLGYLEDDTPNKRLPPAEEQVLLSDMRRTASACAVALGDEGSTPASGGGRK
jgi:hypothetical protein